ncbi:hypothetical protein PIB30_050641 [Stylosanthes scabra]|uniref:Uncharacterized protein n=1 Tax=Stylosanthes scabra TaxID=79078 RepID=A0ABU6UI15_9FABA|nr:hypothetical protein [Stylosanthes scabra]
MSIDSEKGEQYLTYLLVGKINPLSFMNSFTHFDPIEQANSDDFWSRILTARRLLVGLLGESSLALRRKVVSYSPQLVSRQFGLAQALPSPISLNAGEQLVHYEVSDVQELERILDDNHVKIESHFNHRFLSEITRCNLCTPSFASWWSKYFSNHASHIDFDFSHMILPSEMTYSKEKTQGVNLGANLGEWSDSPSNSGQSKSQQNVPSKKKSNPSYAAPSSKKRNIKGLSKGSSSGKFQGTEGPPSRKLKTIFINTETSPIDADEEGEENTKTEYPLLNRVDRTPLPRPSSSQSQPQNLLDSTIALSEPMSPAKQVYISGGKLAPPTHETQGPLEAIVEPGVMETPSLTPIPLATIVAKVYSIDISSLGSRKQELDSMVDGLNVLQQTSAKCAEAVSRITPVLEQGKESEQIMMLKIQALEDELRRPE